MPPPGGPPIRRCEAGQDRPPPPPPLTDGGIKSESYSLRPIKIEKDDAPRGCGQGVIRGGRGNQNNRGRASWARGSVQWRGYYEPKYDQPTETYTKKKKATITIMVQMPGGEVGAKVAQNALNSTLFFLFPTSLTSIVWKVNHHSLSQFQEHNQ